MCTPETRPLARHHGRLVAGNDLANSVCIAPPPMAHLRAFDHCADAQRIEGLAALVAVAGIFQPDADLAVA